MILESFLSNEEMVRDYLKRLSLPYHRNLFFINTYQILNVDEDKLGIHYGLRNGTTYKLSKVEFLGEDKSKYTFRSAIHDRDEKLHGHSIFFKTLKMEAENYIEKMKGIELLNDKL